METGYRNGSGRGPLSTIETNQPLMTKTRIDVLPIVLSYIVIIYVRSQNVPGTHSAMGVNLNGLHSASKVERWSCQMERTIVIFRELTGTSDVHPVHPVPLNVSRERVEIMFCPLMRLRNGDGTNMQENRKNSILPDHRAPGETWVQRRNDASVHRTTILVTQYKYQYNAIPAHK